MTANSGRVEDVGQSLVVCADHNGSAFAPDVSVALLQSADRHDIDGTTQQSGKLVLEVQKIEQRTSGFEVHQEIDVARRRVLPSRHRPEECRGTALVLSHQRADLLPPCFDDRTPLTHDQIVPARSRHSWMGRHSKSYAPAATGGSLVVRVASSRQLYFSSEPHAAQTG